MLIAERHPRRLCYSSWPLCQKTLEAEASPEKVCKTQGRARTVKSSLEEMLQKARLGGGFWGGGEDLAEVSDLFTEEAVQAVRPPPHPRSRSIRSRSIMAKKACGMPFIAHCRTLDPNLLSGYPNAHLMSVHLSCCTALLRPVLRKPPRLSASSARSLDRAHQLCRNW